MVAPMCPRIRPMDTLAQPPSDRLPGPALREALAGLPDWSYDDARQALVRHFRFADFAEALGFMTEVGLHAERRNHHPEWSNVYDRVDVAWTSHDARGVTGRDVAMARVCDQAAAARRLRR